MLLLIQFLLKILKLMGYANKYFILIYFHYWRLIIDELYEEHICGRPLGLSMDRNGFLYVADAYYGIFKVNVNSKDQYGMLF